MASRGLTDSHPVQAAKFRFRSFDQFAEAVAGWDLDWRQLDRGPLAAEMLQAGSPDALVTRVAFNRRFLQKGSPPPGMLTFALPDESAGEIEWCGLRGDHRNLFIFDPRSDYDSISRPGFSVTTISISEDHLASIASHLDAPLALRAIRAKSTVREIDGDVASALRGAVQRLEEVCDGINRTDLMFSLLEHEIPCHLVRLLASNSPASVQRLNHRRIVAAQRARDYIEAHADQIPSIQDLCRVAEVSRRTLNYAFRELIGVTPKQYLQATRLAGVREDLRHRGPDAKIADVANHWGFWHMGQFAADYRQQFGELPSETVRRADRA